MSDVTRIWIWFAGNANIRKWQTTAFEEGTAFVLADEYDALEARASALAEEVERLRGALKEMTEAFRPFTFKPIGAPHSPARLDQEYQIDVHRRTRALLTQADGGAE